MSNGGPILRQGRALRVVASDDAPPTVPGARLKGRAILPAQRVADDEMIRQAAQRDAEAIRAQAQTEAAALRAVAEQEGVALREAARQAGRTEGLERGRTEAQQELQDALQLVRGVAGDVQALRDTVLHESEQQILHLLATATRRIVGEVVEAHPEIVERIAADAIRRAGDQQILRLRVHPDSAAILSARYGPDESWEIRADEALAVGGCIVETAAGIIDASIEGQVSEILSAWQDDAP